jgi:hypothetical protein
MRRSFAPLFVLIWLLVALSSVGSLSAQELDRSDDFELVRGVLNLPACANLQMVNPAITYAEKYRGITYWWTGADLKKYNYKVLVFPILADPNQPQDLLQWRLLYKMPNPPSNNLASFGMIGKQAYLNDVHPLMQEYV